MDQKHYLNQLAEMKKAMNSKKSPLAEHIKILTLSRLMMEIENIYDPEMDVHPYAYVAECIKETTTIFNQMISMSKFEDKSVRTGIYKKEKNVTKKHKELWQEIWTKYDENEFQRLMAFRGARLDINGINCYIKDKKCVDFGCGNGNFALALLERGAKSVFGIDFGEKNVRFANGIVKKRGLGNVAKFETRDILDSGLPDEEYEFALCSAVLHHLDTKKDMALAIKEISRVLKSGSGFFSFVTGAGAISIYVRETCVEILSDISNSFIEHKLLPLNLTREKMTHLIDALKATYLRSEPEEFIEMLTNAGFCEIRRLNSAPGDTTSWDINVLEKDTYGKEKYGTGELRYFCIKN